MNNTEYAPRKGSKVALAAEALRNGALPASELAKVMNTDCGSVNVLLAVAVEHNYIVKVDKLGVMHYALGGMKLDPALFKPYKPAPVHAGGSHVADGPVVRKVATPSVTPSAAALAAATPFWPGRAAESAPPARSKGESNAAERATTAPTPEQSSGFAAGLFSTGELVINAGEECIRLSREHTRELFDYLDKITDMIAA